MPVGAVFSGLILGMLGALGAVGLALVWRSNKVVNFAHGDLGALPATLAVLLVTIVGFNWFLAVATGLLAAVVLGVLVEVVVVRRFFDAPRLQLTVATLGLAQVLAFGALLLPRAWGQGPAVRNLPAPFELAFSVGEVNFDANDLVALVVAPILIAAVAAFLRLTPTGVAVRAAADDVDRASMLGIPVRRIEGQVWVMATVLSFVSVILTAGVIGLPFGLGAGLAIVTRSLAALVIGRMTHLVAISVTAVALGVLEAGIRWNTGDAYLVSAVLAVLVIASLLFQRRGVTRSDRDDEAALASATEVRPVPPEIAREPKARLLRASGIVVVAAAVVVGPVFLGTNGQLKAGVIAIFALVGLSVVILTGWAGQVSLGQMLLVGVGAAVGAWCMVERRWDPLTCMIIAGPAGALVAVLIGLPALRLRGLYLAVTTLVVSVAASEWVFSNRAVSWIPEGTIDRTRLFNRIEIDTPLRLYYMVLVTLALVLWALRGLRRARPGRILIALRDNEDGVAAFGVSPTRAKLSAFALSGFVAAIAGVLLVVHQGAFRPVSYTPEESITVFTATVIGGLGSLTGALLGAVFQRGSQWLLPAPWSLLATGAGVLVVLLVMPDGLGGALWRARDRVLSNLFGAPPDDPEDGGESDPAAADPAAVDVAPADEGSEVAP